MNVSSSHMHERKRDRNAQQRGKGDVVGTQINPKALSRDGDWTYTAASFPKASPHSDCYICLHRVIFLLTL